MKHFAKGTPVIVYWEDAGDHECTDWIHSDKVKASEMLSIVSCGVYLGIKKRYLMIATDYCPKDGNTHTISQIPMGCVKRIVKLKE
jgi:hypothetical protein